MPYNEIILLARVVETIERHGMFSAGDRVAVAVSGGADSVCLLHVLRELAPRWNLTLSVVHVNHNLRGDESRGDAEFVRGLAGALGLPFRLHELDLSERAGNLEEAGREGRNAVFQEYLAGGFADRVAVGHTRSDQAETVLFRFLRGSGATGLAAIRPVTERGVIRPLIDLERAEILRFLGERGLGWREDASNATLDFARNRIRHQLLPQLTREWNPALVETLAHTADLSLAEEAYWQAEIERLAARHLVRNGDAVLISALELGALPLAAARRLVRHAIQLVTGGRPAGDFRQVAAVLALAARRQGTGRVQLPGIEVRRSFEWLRMGKEEARMGKEEARQECPLDRGHGSLKGCATGYCLRPAVPGVTPIPGTDKAITLEMHENPRTMRCSDNVYNSQVGCLDWNRLSGPLELRNWRPGDQYRPMGIPAAKKIKTLFQEARVPVWERAQWPVLTDAESIVWARRFGAAAAVAAGNGSSKVLAVGEVKVR